MGEVARQARLEQGGVMTDLPTLAWELVMLFRRFLEKARADGLSREEIEKQFTAALVLGVLHVEAEHLVERGRVEEALRIGREGP